jgi:antitoxin PrlF
VAAITNLRARGQITIPLQVREALGLEEGDPVLVEVTKEGILLCPQKMVDAAQAWFWTASWPAGERESSKDIEAGRVIRYDGDEEFLSSLET